MRRINKFYYLIAALIIAVAIYFIGCASFSDWWKSWHHIEVIKDHEPNSVDTTDSN